LAPLRPEAPAGLIVVLERMLAKRPEDRFATPGEVAKALEPFTPGHDLPALRKRAASEVKSPSEQPTLPLPASRRPGGTHRCVTWARRRPIRAALSAAAVLSLVLLVLGITARIVPPGPNPVAPSPDDPPDLVARPPRPASPVPGASAVGLMAAPLGSGPFL